MKIKYANEKDLEIINKYFEDSGETFTSDDNIAVFDSPVNVTYYLYKDNIMDMLSEMEKRNPIDENMNLIQNLVDDLRNVFKSDDGTYYVIK